MNMRQWFNKSTASTFRRRERETQRRLRVEGLERRELMAVDYLAITSISSPDDVPGTPTVEVYKGSTVKVGFDYASTSDPYLTTAWVSLEQKKVVDGVEVEYQTATDNDFAISSGGTVAVPKTGVIGIPVPDSAPEGDYKVVLHVKSQYKIPKGANDVDVDQTGVNDAVEVVAFAVTLTIRERLEAAASEGAFSVDVLQSAINTAKQGDITVNLSGHAVYAEDGSVLVSEEEIAALMTILSTKNEDGSLAYTFRLTAATGGYTESTVEYVDDDTSTLSLVFKSGNLSSGVTATSASSLTAQQSLTLSVCIDGEWVDLGSDLVKLFTSTKK